MTKSRTLCAALSCTLAVLILCVAPLRAQNQDHDPAASRAAAVLDSLPHAKRIDRVAISPDGTQVAYIVDKETHGHLREGRLRLTTIAVDGDLPLRHVAWSADSKRIAFLADLAGRCSCRSSLDRGTRWQFSGEACRTERICSEPRASLPMDRNSPFLFIAGMPRVAGPLQPMTPLAGVIDEKIYEQRIALLDLGTDHLTEVTPADLYVYEYDWTPDGQGWAATAAHGSGDANWWLARLYTVNAQSGEMREIYKPKLQIADPQVSPDGKNVAFIEGIDER